ncbi:ABC transporter ATP-binding protein [Mesorhizobium sp. CU2]|uniref:ABC transporter ATP-binding protein n=1 Tax=unclassified Mesorhizobium TaxID=325217 RepID=UPI001127EC8D|nr:MULTISPECIES: ABC transporter ATP-binding protein [unclassified Mesorhizobium]TPN83218.1 ABC transporter ATP-binding protein [Mesorhizobium sp. CU3]TPO12230.1 ABC transporter ATP-binding protein [Mesorhizobium sp. CU2]
MSPVIEARGLIKRYGRSPAVDGIDLTIEKGEVFGLLGPNGSGKTTTILLLLGLTEPTAGSIRVLGLDPLRQPLTVKRQVGYLPDQIGFYDHLTAWENLAYTARLAGLMSGEADGRIAGALRRVRLAEVADRRVATFSRGMRQRLGLAEVLVKQAEIAILDEPTSGLDPQATQELLELIRELADEGVTFVLSSHQLAMMQTICSRVALFRKGQVGLIGRVEDLTASILGGAYKLEVETEKADLVNILAGAPHISGLTALKTGHWLVDADADVRADIACRVVGAGGALHSMAIRQATLDEVYVRFFEGESHDVAA